MDGYTGKLGKLEKLLRLPAPGSFSARRRRLNVIFGLLIVLLNVYVPLFTESASLSTVAVSLMGFAVALQGIGDAARGRSGSVIRLSSLLLFVAVAVLLVMFAYTEFSLTDLLFVALLIVPVLGLIWFLKRMSAGA